MKTWQNVYWTQQSELLELQVRRLRMPKLITLPQA
jgi:hypothetical protein